MRALTIYVPTGSGLFSQTWKTTLVIVKYTCIRGKKLRKKRRIKRRKQAPL
jgi:hypothetical protein